jgi:hypothetical protein
LPALLLLAGLLFVAALLLLARLLFAGALLAALVRIVHCVFLFGLEWKHDNNVHNAVKFRELEDKERVRPP